MSDLGSLALTHNSEKAKRIPLGFCSVMTRDALILEKTLLNQDS